MWKESYSIGVDLIDKQHKELFGMVENLLNEVQDESGDKRKECISAITFLKEYTLQHFSDEEEYQRSINYSGLEEHIKIHKQLVRAVLVHEQKMKMTNFNTTEIRDFIGMLIGWLVCHVAGDDQLIATGNSASTMKSHSSLDSFFYMSICEILSKVTGISIKDIKVVKLDEGIVQPIVSVAFNLQGDISGMVTYNYTQQLAFNLMKNMASFSPLTIDEMVISAMMELSSFTSVKSIGMMSTHGYSSKFELPNVNTIPAFIPSQSSIILDTGMGLLELDVALS